MTIDKTRWTLGWKHQVNNVPLLLEYDDADEPVWQYFVLSESLHTLDEVRDYANKLLALVEHLEQETRPHPPAK